MRRRENRQWSGLTLIRPLNEKDKENNRRWSRKRGRGGCNERGTRDAISMKVKGRMERAREREMVENAEEYSLPARRRSTPPSTAGWRQRHKRAVAECLEVSTNHVSICLVLIVVSLFRLA
jgi:hypothetical protein